MPTLLQQWITAHAQRSPEAAAVVAEGERVTYGQLDARANQFARVLRELGCGRGDRVAILAANSPIAIAAILGVLRADAVYVPLDPSSPPSRLGRILASSEPAWILAAGGAGELLDALVAMQPAEARSHVAWIDTDRMPASRLTPMFTRRDLDACPAGPIASRIDASAIAYIMYTSGSTGVPKGVAVTHASIIAFVEWAVRYFGMDATDRTSGHAPLYFDLSTFDLFGTFAAGAELHIVPPALNLLPQKLARFIRDAELTQWFSVPSALNYMARFDVARQDDFPHMRRLLWCGEVFPTPSLIYWMKRLPHVQFTNLYGPTETTVASTYHTVPACPTDERAAIPIGRPCGGEQVLVLDESMAPVPAGVSGEIYIGGAGLSPGYWRDPDRTRQAFVRDPRNGQERLYRTGDLGRFDDQGDLYFLGRVDSQIKSRGYRIELGEVESALNALGMLQECAVVAPPTEGFEGRLICCAYAPLPGQSLAPSQLRSALQRKLPTYMLPSRWVQFERLPKNLNGKIDRRQLTSYFQGHETAAAG